MPTDEGPAAFQFLADAYYTVAHTSTFAIVDPTGNLVAILDDTEKATALADELESLHRSTAEPTGWPMPQSLQVSPRMAYPGGLLSCQRVGHRFTVRPFRDCEIRWCEREPEAQT